MREVTLNEKHIKLLDQCKELRVKVQPERPNTDEDVISFALGFYKYFLKDLR